VHVLPRQVHCLPVEIIFAILEAGYYLHDFQQDTRFLLNASLVSRSWRRPAQLLLFQHVVIRSEAAFTALCNATSSNATHGEVLAGQVRSLSAALDPEQPGCLQPPSLCHAISLFPNLSELDLACYSFSKPQITSYQRDGKSFSIFDDKALSTLCSGPPISALRLANWSSDTSLLDKLLGLYQPSLRVLSLRGAHSSFSTPATSRLASHHALDLTLQPPLASTLLDWLTNRTTRPRIHTLEFIRQPEHAVLAALLATHGDGLKSLALPTLTTADAALVAAHCSPRLKSLRTEHPYAALPALRLHLHHVALAVHPALTLVREQVGMLSGIGMRGRLEHVSVILWRGNEEEQRAVRALKLLCAQLGVWIRFEREVKEFRARFREAVVQRT
jgi:F-box-like